MQHDIKISKNCDIGLTDRSLIVICLDESGSMAGSPWKEIVQGTKEFIDFAKNNHNNLKQVQ